MLSLVISGIFVMEADEQAAQGNLQETQSEVDSWILFQRLRLRPEPARCIADDGVPASRAKALLKYPSAWYLLQWDDVTDLLPLPAR